MALDDRLSDYEPAPRAAGGGDDDVGVVGVVALKVVAAHPGGASEHVMQNDHGVASRDGGTIRA